MATLAKTVAEKAKVLFDLNGYIVIRGLLTSEELTRARDAISAHRGEFVERKDRLRNTTKSCDESFVGDGHSGRFDLGGILAWTEGESIFRDLLVHPKLVPYLHLFLGEGFRLDHSPLIIKQIEGSEGFVLHGGRLEHDGSISRSLQYQCLNQQIHNSLIAVSFQLSDHNPGDGGFCVVKGSHKMNFPLTRDMLEGRDQDFVENCLDQPVTKAGDCIIFTEATVHGAFSWKCKDFERLIALYRFAPATSAYARGCYQWPESYLKGMNKEQLALMQPPYNIRFDRPRLREDGSIGEPSVRSHEKKEFDRLVFNQDYF